AMMLARSGAPANSILTFLRMAFTKGTPNSPQAVTLDGHAVAFHRARAPADGNHERRSAMRSSSRVAHLGVAVAAVLAVVACGAPPSSSGSTGSAATARTAASLGGMNALVTAAKKEGTLNVIA